MIQFALPWPPSMNHYWRSRVIVPRGNPKGAFSSTYVSSDGVAYQATVKQHIIPLRIAQLHGRLELHVTANVPDRRGRDLDNLLKPLLDSMMYAGLYEDDSQFDKITIERGKIIKGGEVIVTITQRASSVLF